MSGHALEAGPWSGPAPDLATPKATHLALQTMLRGYGDRYPNLRTRANNLNDLNQLFRMAGVDHPAELTTRHIVEWATRTPANNSVRQHVTVIRTFTRWCVREGHLPAGYEPDVAHLVKQYPKTYGKQQSKHPARFLTRAEADRLIAACQDATWLGSRDQLIIRLGLLGVRAKEMCDMTFGAQHPDDRLRWIGKGRRPRTVTPGPNLLALLPRWARYATSRLGRPVEPTDRLLPTFRDGPTHEHPIGWKAMTHRHLPGREASGRTVRTGPRRPPRPTTHHGQHPPRRRHRRRRPPLRPARHPTDPRPRRPSHHHALLHHAHQHRHQRPSGDHPRLTLRPAAGCEVVRPVGDIVQSTRLSSRGAPRPAQPR